MKRLKDNFSNQSKSYKKYRPGYPKELYEIILSTIKTRNECWDCGTGNGQVANELSKYFKKVSATDISENQIELAEKKANIQYQKIRSESTNFKSDQFDLITVAQAIHWFDFQSFYKEVRRVGKKGGKLIVWGYGLVKIEKEIDDLVNKFYAQKMGSYWDIEREHIDSEYETIEFDFKELQSPSNLSIKSNWDVNHLIGFLNSWSSVQNYKVTNKGKNPVEEIAKELLKKWKKDELKQVKFPIFMKIGLIEK